MKKFETQEELDAFFNELNTQLMSDFQPDEMIIDLEDDSLYQAFLADDIIGEREEVPNFTITELDTMVKYIEEECKDLTNMAKGFREDGMSDEEVLDTFGDDIAKNRDVYHNLRYQILETAYKYFKNK